MNVKTVERVYGEERSGFYVQSMMKRAWLVQLDILKEIDAICRRHHIKYFAQWGTLLGAVRHRGFIPWDDDIDIAMLRSDYERFRYYAKTELPEGWRIKKVFPTLIRVLNSDSIRLDQGFLDRYHGCPYIMGVDLFALDHFPQDKADRGLFMNLFEAVYSLHKHWESFEEECIEQGLPEENKWVRLKEIEELTGYSFDRESPVKEQLYDLADHIAAMYWDVECDEVTQVSRLNERPGYHIPKSCFDRIIEVPFENTTIPIPEDYEPLLRVNYGDDYMIPVQGNAGHDYPFFRKQMEVLRDHFEEQGITLPDFFDMVLEQVEE